MKSRLLLLAFLFTAIATTTSAQTYRIDWDEADSASGPATEQFKRNGYLVNENSTPKHLLFRYDLSAVATGHMTAMCFGDFCFFLFPGEDIPTDREAQTLPGNGSLKIYTLLNANGNNGTSTFAITLFDETNTTDTVRFTCTFFVGPTSTVPEIGTLGFSAGPLPATDVVTVTGDQARVIVGANLYSSSGSLLRTYGLVSGTQHTFNVSDLTSGTYHLVLTTSSGQIVRTPVVIAR